MSITQFDQELNHQLIQLMKNNRLPWQQPRKGNNPVPYHGQTGNIFHGRNLVRLLMTDYEDKSWYTYDQVKANGGAVKKGQKGIRLVLISEVKNNNESIYLTNSYHFFNREQTTLETKPFVNQPLVSIDTIKSIANDIKFNHYDDESILRTLSISIVDKRSSDNNQLESAVIAEVTTYLSSLEAGVNYQPQLSTKYYAEWLDQSNKKESIFIDVLRKATIAKAKVLQQSKQDIINRQSQIANFIINEENFTENVIKNTMTRDDAIASLNIKEKVYLAIPYKDRELANRIKEAHYDRENSCWYTYQPVHSQIKGFLPENKSSNIGNSVNDFIQFAESIGVNASHKLSGGDFSSDHFDKKIRVPIVGKDKGNRSGCILIQQTPDGTIFGHVTNFITSEKKTWQCFDYKNKSSTPAHIKHCNNAAKKQKDAIESEVKSFIRSYQSNKAMTGLSVLPDANHSITYVKNKGMQNLNGLKMIPKEDALIVPLTDGNKITSVQLVSHTEKRIQINSQIKGSYFHFGDIYKADLIIIAEGLSTTESLYQAVMYWSTPTGHFSKLIFILDWRHIFIRRMQPF